MYYQSIDNTLTIKGEVKEEKETEEVKPKRISISTSSPKMIEGTASEVKEKVK